MLRGGTAAGEPFPQPIRVTPGDTFSVVLAENPSSGFRWMIAQAPDEAIAVLESEDYVPSTPMAIGSGGRKTLTFRATGRGQATLILEHRRPWDKGRDPIDRRTYALIVE